VGQLLNNNPDLSQMQIIFDKFGMQYKLDNRLNLYIALTL